MSKNSFEAFANAAILVADPNSESLYNIASILIAQNHVVKLASSFDEAIGLARREVLDLLITETWLENKSGAELIAEVRTISDHSDLPVMFVTENQSPDVIRRAHQPQGAFHLKKPIDPNVLCELVAKALWMPHLVNSHIEQKMVKQPHVSFAKNPLASPFDTMGIGGVTLPGTPISF